MRQVICLCGAATLVIVSSLASVAAEGALARGAKQRSAPDRSLLTTERWTRLDRAVDRGIRFIVQSQQSDGSFPTSAEGQPGVTSLCIMALLARGHQPGKGPYGRQIERAIDYVLSMQDPQIGAIMADRWYGGTVRRVTDGRPRSFPGNYNHGISGVMLAEVYGMTDAKRHERIREAVIRALKYTRKDQIRPKPRSEDRGGWRYVHREPSDSDLSVTAWQLMFLRSARNAEFDVPKEWIDEALAYVRRTFDTRERGFVYSLEASERYCSRAMVGAGIVCLELGGEHGSDTSEEAGRWILRHSFVPYMNAFHPEDRYHYSAFYCSQAMFQLGGDYWQRFFPNFLDVLADAQHADGSWDRERANGDGIYGNSYTTALIVLALATPYQLLPIYQR